MCGLGHVTDPGEASEADGGQGGGGSVRRRCGDSEGVRERGRWQRRGVCWVAIHWGW